MGKGIAAISKINLRNIKVAYIVSGIFALVMIIQTAIELIVLSSSGNQSLNSSLSPGAYAYLLIILAAIVIPTKNFRRIINLGGKRNSFFWGTLLTYVILAVSASVFNSLMFYTFDNFVQNSGHFDNAILNGVMNTLEVFGWSRNGILISFFQQTAFLFLLASFIHTFVSIQDKWYGWVTTAVIAAILAVFIPITPLREALIWFFDMILSYSNPLLQIVNCIVLGIVIYAFNKPAYDRKAI